MTRRLQSLARGFQTSTLPLDPREQERHIGPPWMTLVQLTQPCEPQPQFTADDVVARVEQLARYAIVVVARVCDVVDRLTEYPAAPAE